MDQKELGNRLSAARQAVRMTQAEAARGIGKSRSMLALIEAGERTIDSFDLARLARLYHRPLESFFAAKFEDSDALTVLTRSSGPESLSQEVLDELYRCAEIARTISSLEQLLGIDPSDISPPRYDLPVPRGVWNAVEQGESLAERERTRLNLGLAPVKDMAAVFEPQGIRLASISMPDGISGAFLHDSSTGLVVLINSAEEYSASRQRFSATHEYCHVLVDRKGINGEISLRSRSKDLPEVRANAFAAAFLMPRAGVENFLRRISKGKASRSVLGTGFDGEGAVTAQRRSSGGSQDLRLLDIVHICEHFGVSFDTALYRLQNLKIITEPERKRFADQIESAQFIRSTLPVRIQDRDQGVENGGMWRVLEHECLGRGIDAYAQDLITARRLQEIANLISVSVKNLDQMLLADGLPATSERKVGVVRGAQPVDKRKPDGRRPHR